MIATFDLEIYKMVKNMSNWKAEAPLGISCAAVGIEGQEEPRFWSHPRPVLDHAAARGLVVDLLNISKANTIVSWNGAQFDFQVLSQESGETDFCIELALNHVDLMFLVYCIRGHFLGLDKALAGCELKGKVHEVKLSTGEALLDMSGAKAPQLWQAGEYQAVLDYLRGDVMQPLELFKYIERNKFMKFGGFYGVTLIKPFPLLTVQQALDFEDRGAWKTPKAGRKKFLNWIFEE